MSGGAGSCDSYAIIQAVAALASGLGMTTTAEGIETEEQLAAVLDRGCTEGQGFLFGHPVPMAELRPMFGQKLRRVA